MFSKIQNFLFNLWHTFWQAIISSSLKKKIYSEICQHKAVMYIQTTHHFEDKWLNVQSIMLNNINSVDHDKAAMNIKTWLLSFIPSKGSQLDSMYKSFRGKNSGEKIFEENVRACWDWNQIWIWHLYSSKIPLTQKKLCLIITW